MTKLRLDEPRFLRGRLTRNMPVWVEEVEFAEDGSKIYTERYRQLKLITLMKALSK